MIGDISPILSLSHHHHHQTDSIQWSYFCTLFACLYWLECPLISILTGCKCCSSPARVSLLYTCLNVFVFFSFFCYMLVQKQNKTLNLVFLFPICLVLLCCTIKLPPHSPPTLLHLGKWFIFFMFLFPFFFYFYSWSVCVVSNGTFPLPPYPTLPDIAFH